jgi:transposase-like protein
MPGERRRKFDAEFREGAVRVVHETGKPIAQVARDLGIHEGTLGNWVAKDRAEREGRDGLSREDVAELKRLRAEVAELRMERDVLIGRVERRVRASRRRRLVMS